MTVFLKKQQHKRCCKTYMSAGTVNLHSLNFNF